MRQERTGSMRLPFDYNRKVLAMVYVAVTPVEQLHYSQLTSRRVPAGEVHTMPQQIW